MAHLGGRVLSSSQPTQDDPTNLSGHSNAAPTDSASSSPLSSPRSISSPSCLPHTSALAGSPTCRQKHGHDLDNAAGSSPSAGLGSGHHLSTLQDRAACSASSKPADNFRTRQSPNVASSGRKKRARSNPIRYITAPHDHSAQDQDADTEPTGEPKKKARKMHETSSVGNRAAERPLLELVDQIGQPDKIANIEEEVRKLKARPCQLPDPAESLHSRARMHTDLPLTHIVHAIPHVTREIEATSLNEQLSRIRNRIALADFYCAYRTAHARPEDFLQELDQGPPQHIMHPRARNRTRRGQIKESFIQLVFCQSTGEREWKKDSTRVNNWQKTGRPWFELIQRFGTGILLLVPEEVTNRR